MRKYVFYNMLNGKFGEPFETNTIPKKPDHCVLYNLVEVNAPIKRSAKKQPTTPKGKNN